MHITKPDWPGKFEKPEVAKHRAYAHPHKMSSKTHHRKITSPDAEAAETVVSLPRQCEDKCCYGPLKHLRHPLSKTSNDRARKVKMVPQSAKFIPFTFYNIVSHTAGLLCNSMNFKKKEKPAHYVLCLLTTVHGIFREKCWNISETL